jgi:hypothetical protein
MKNSKVFTMRSGRRGAGNFPQYFILKKTKMFLERSPQSSPAYFSSEFVIKHEKLYNEGILKLVIRKNHILVNFYVLIFLTRA